jgi:glycosyltransferase involved in cell wall biosynthesis
MIARSREVAAIHVVVGLEGVQVPANMTRGIGRWSIGMVGALVAASPEIRVSVSATSDPTIRDALSHLGDSVEFLHTGQVPESGIAEATIFHIASAMEDRPISVLWPRWARDPSVGLVTTLYDMIPMLRPDEYFAGRLRFPMLARYEVHRHADRLVAISDKAKSDAAQLLGIGTTHIDVIPAGLGDQFVPGEPDLMRLAEQEVRPGAVLCIGNVDARKNLTSLIDAFALVPEQVRGTRQLVVTLSQIEDVQRSSLLERAATRGIGESIRVLGNVDDATLVALYRSCDVLAYMSLSEGLGLPVLEAMGCGVAVLTSDVEPMASLVPRDQRSDPRSVRDIAHGLTRLLSNEGERRRMAAQGPSLAARFRWNACTASLAAVYRRVAERLP